jgi:NDP-sugar pyrophosphorylase family protein
MVETIKNAHIDMQAVILAGGKGNRMGKHTNEKQKCMLEVDGAPIIEHILSGLAANFGKRMQVIIATGYKGNEVRQYFGDNFERMKLFYVHDERPLETKNRLMLAKELLVKPFFFLAGDVLTPNFVLEQVASRFEQEQSSKSTSVVGVISGAKDHSPAPTHAVLTVQEGYLQNIAHPPPTNYNENDLRESHQAIYSLDFLKMANQSKEKLLSRVIQEIITGTSKKFGVEGFESIWAHYADPIDLEKYKNLSFLRNG